MSGGVEALAQLPHNRLQALHELISQEQAGEGMSVYSSMRTQQYEDMYACEGFGRTTGAGMSCLSLIFIFVYTHTHTYGCRRGG